MLQVPKKLLFHELSFSVNERLLDFYLFLLISKKSKNLNMQIMEEKRVTVWVGYDYCKG